MVPQSLVYLQCLSYKQYNFCVQKKNQLDATGWFIALTICPTCFGQFYAHHQDLDTICVITTYGVRCLGFWLSEVRCRAAGCASVMRDVARLQSSNIPHSGRIAQKCPKHVEHIISAINHSVASSWFFLFTHMQRSTDKHTSNSNSVSAECKFWGLKLNIYYI